MEGVLRRLVVLVCVLVLVLLAASAPLWVDGGSKPAVSVQERLIVAPVGGGMERDRERRRETERERGEREERERRERGERRELAKEG